MKFQSRFWKAALFSMLATGVVSANALAGCEGLFKYGIYDIDEKTNDADRTISFREWFCQKELPGKTDAVSVLSSASIPLETVPVKLGSQDSDSDFKESYSAFCADTNIGSPRNQDLSRKLQNINPTVIRNLNACMSGNGLHAWIKQTKDTGRFFVNFLYRGPQSNSKPATVFSVTRFNITCDNLRLPFDIAGGERSFTCTRIDTKSQSSLWILASEPVVEGNSYNVGKTTYTPPPARQ